MDKADITDILDLQSHQVLRRRRSACTPTDVLPDAGDISQSRNKARTERYFRQLSLIVV